MDSEEPSTVVDGQLRAYNAQDTAKFASFYAEDVGVYDFPSGTERTRGRAALAYHGAASLAACSCETAWRRMYAASSGA